MYQLTNEQKISNLEELYMQKRKKAVNLSKELKQLENKILKLKEKPSSDEQPTKISENEVTQRFNS